MMYIYPALLFILYVYIGFSEAAPRVNPYDASSNVISRKPRSASETLESYYTIMPNRLPEDRFVLGPLPGFTPSPSIASTGVTSNTRPVSASHVSGTATTFQPPTTDPTTPSIESISTTRDQITAFISRISGSSKRSTDAQTSVFPPEKMMQTMVSMVSQRTTNNAWPADIIETHITSTENSQGEFLLFYMKYACITFSCISKQHLHLREKKIHTFSHASMYDDKKNYHHSTFRFQNGCNTSFFYYK